MGGILGFYVDFHRLASASTTMGAPYLKVGLFFIVSILSSNLQAALGFRFVIDKEECFFQRVPYEGDIVHAYYVVIKYESTWHYEEEEAMVDLIVTGPSGEQIHNSVHKPSDMFEFSVPKRGLHQFCFRNKSPYSETIEFDLRVGHFAVVEEHAKDEHVNPLLGQIYKLEEALYNVQFEQHWLEAQTERQALVNEGMSKRAIHKALTEFAALISASILQVYLLQRLFQRKLGTSRV